MVRSFVLVCIFWFLHGAVSYSRCSAGSSLFAYSGLCMELFLTRDALQVRPCLHILDSAWSCFLHAMLCRFVLVCIFWTLHGAVSYTRCSAGSSLFAYSGLCMELLLTRDALQVRP